MLRGAGVAVLLVFCFAATDALAQSTPLTLATGPSGTKDVKGTTQAPKSASEILRGLYEPLPVLLMPLDAEPDEGVVSMLMPLEPADFAIMSELMPACCDPNESTGSDRQSVLMQFSDVIARRTQATKVYYHDDPVRLGVRQNPAPLLAAYEAGVLGEQSVVASAKLQVYNHPTSSGARTVACNLEIPGRGLLDWNGATVAPGEAATLYLSTLAPAAAITPATSTVYLRCFVGEKATAQVDVNYVKLVVQYGAHDVEIHRQ